MEIKKMVAYVGLILLIILLLIFRPILGITFCIVIIVVIFYNRNKKIKLTSFMRDILVTIPGYGEGKLNAAFAFGGPTKASTTIENPCHADPGEA